MPNNRRLLACFLLIMPTLLMFVGFAQATVLTLTIQNGETMTYPIELAIDDHVLIQFTVTGQAANTIHFSMISPNGTVRDFGDVGNYHFTFICNAKGDYVFNFTNTDLTENKLVTLNYEIDHYIFDMPQMYFMTMLIAVICVGGVAVFIMLSKKP